MTSRAATPEGKLERKALAWLNAQPDTWATPYHVSALAKVGKPDIFASIRGQFVGIEMKATPLLEPTVIQKATGFEMVKKGALWHVVGSLDHIKLIHSHPAYHERTHCRWCGPEGPL